ncbi:MAG: UDP-N-acetylglucosamine 2-epimerase (non-hydrolyzing) [Deltaproteobacteria bacterium]|jgi:UDP-N-acetylglucosamine 2-epimerase (non-hydrolysing)|nr:UDP-N-acetylglucosamine 2-epimerase (non-hydrolyzing) [Deltaproteobacteria bacterium]MBW2535066.1 UDP-N-acetylglucosamine 2-epimerase (non-hydrolyzing) [Deltaproteobacteria bacterium]
MRRLAVLHVAGARPNFVKLAPLMRAMAKRDDLIEQRWAFTGQHFDHPMSRVFIEQLELPPPTCDLAVGPAPVEIQVARTVERLAEMIRRLRPDWIFVLGDVTSSVAAAQAGAQMGVPVAHVEAGLRCFDGSMPEERNRVLIDQLSQQLFTPSADADDNLRQEGVERRRIHRVGNVMIDTLLALRSRAASAISDLAERLDPRLAELALAEPTSPPFALVTVHRPHNVDEEEALRPILAALRRISRRLPVVFPLHPRTRARLEQLGAAHDELARDVLVVPPLPYLEFVGLEQRAALVLTDSGGVQEETTVLDVPCLTLRTSTERPVTIRLGTNRLVVPETDAIVEATHAALDDPPRCCQVPEGWDGHTAERIVEVLLGSV